MRYIFVFSRYEMDIRFLIIEGIYSILLSVMTFFSGVRRVIKSEFTMAQVALLLIIKVWCFFWGEKVLNIFLLWVIWSEVLLLTNYNLFLRIIVSTLEINIISLVLVIWVSGGLILRGFLVVFLRYFFS